MEGTQSNRSAIGAKVTVTTDAMARMQMVSGGGGRGSQNSLPLEFGLGQSNRILRAEVLWPSGLVQDITEDVSLDSKFTIKELALVSESSVCPGLNTFRVTGAPPNSDLIMYSGEEGGVSSVRSGDVCAGTSLDFTRARTFTRLRTNGRGEAFTRRNLSAAKCGPTRRFQVVNSSTCSTSNVIALPQ